MKFLDLNGLTYFFGKVKTWVSINYLSLIGGTIRGNVTFLHEGDGGTSIVVSPSSITKSGHDNHYLFASGKMIPIGEANGVAGLDANGKVPLSQLGNLDTTVAEVVTTLPTTNIKKHIYLIKDASGVSQNQYKEYIYTGNTSATYDASKWEKLGDFRATVDLADYAKKSEAVAKISHVVDQTHITVDYSTIDNVSLGAASFFGATNTNAGLMIPADKIKLNGIAEGANNYSLPTASSTTKGGITLGYSQSGKNYPVVLDGNGKAYVNVPWTDTNTTYDLSPYAKTADVNAALAKKVDVVSGKGLSTHDFTSAYKSKLDGISSGATADSAITTAEIDALFT